MRQYPFLLVVSGAFFLVSGFILYLFTWFFIWSFSLLLIGGVLLLLTKNNWIFKLVVVGIPLTYVAITFYNSFATPATYLIPQGYRGNVMVVFNQKDGRDKEYEGQSRIYRIPATGVLFTKFKDEEGFINEQYFYINPAGQRTKLGVLDTRDFNEEWTLEKNPHELPRDSLAIFDPGTMGTLGSSSDTSHEVFIELSVGTYNDIGKNVIDFTPEYINSLKIATKKNGY